MIDSDTGRPLYDVFKVRSIRAGKVFAVQLTEFTWVKLNWGKDQTKGWANGIPSIYRTECREGEKFDCLHRSKTAALRQARQWHKAMLDRIAKREAAVIEKPVEVRPSWPDVPRWTAEMDEREKKEGGEG
jgi:hypothetical protein